jgi:hypothetical protein
MLEETNDWTAPEVTPLTDADGASTHPTARVRNGFPVSG